MPETRNAPISLSERELRELKVRAFDCAPTGIAISSAAEGRFIYVNERFCRIAGLPAEQLVGATGHDLNMWVDPDDRDRFANQLRETGRVEDLEHVFMRPDGERRIGRLSAELVSTDGMGRIVTTVIDVTEQHRAQEQLQQSEARMRALARAAPDLLLITSPEGRILEVLSEPSREKLLTEKPGTLRGARIQDVLPSALSEDFADALRLSVAKGEPQRVEYCLDRTAQARWFEVVSIASLDGTSHTNAILWVVRDITIQKRNEETTRRESQRRQFFARQLIKVQEAERRRIAGELHDDLSQILTALKLRTRQLISHADDSDLVREGGQHLIEHLSTAMNSVHNLATGLHPGILDDLGLGPALESLASQISVDGTLTIELQCDPGVESAPPETKTALYRIAQEALTNIARHAKATEVSVTMTLSGDCIELKVTDDGSGPRGAELDNPERLGLTSMRERAGLLGGSLSIGESQAGGFEVIAQVPNR